LIDFSGYLAADELYDDPYCVLSIVDNRPFRRLTYRVLDHDPTHDDVLCFFNYFKKELDRHGLVRQAIITDGSPLVVYRDQTVEVDSGPNTTFQGVEFGGLDS
jgi:hypothetical protein